jgi:hypothetical protein
MPASARGGVIMKRALLILAASVILVSCPNVTDPTTNVVLGQYTLLAWNDLGMHCLNPGYDKGVVLPPYNTLWAQVILRGAPPKIVTSGITVSYAIEGNTYSKAKLNFGGFWTHMTALFGVFPVVDDVGLKGKGLAGTMDLAASGDHYVAEGIPVVPYNDSDLVNRNPYQVAVITVTSGPTTLVTTKTTIPTSDEMDCASCHTTHDANAFQDMLIIHDTNEGTDLQNPVNQPFTCASGSCHADPALGISGSEGYLSYVVHHKHSTVASPPACYDCHPGANTRCSRSAEHTSSNGNCVTCHGDLSTMASSVVPGGRIPWAGEPKCATCHTGVAGVNTYTTLYRNSKGHGDLYCAACHGSPHAMTPTSSKSAGYASDSHQVLQYQGYTGRVKVLGSCGVCHDDSRGESDMGEFAEVHGGLNPEEPNGCSACHTDIPTATASWPHAHTWNNSN